MTSVSPLPIGGEGEGAELESPPSGGPAKAGTPTQRRSPLTPRLLSPCGGEGSLRFGLRISDRRLMVRQDSRTPRLRPVTSLVCRNVSEQFKTPLKTPRKPAGRFWSFLPWLLVAPIVLRLLFMHRYDMSLKVDLDMYGGISDWLSEEYVFARPDTGHPTAYRPPLYPLLLAVISWVTNGNDLNGSLHLLLGLSTIWLTWAVSIHFVDQRLGCHESNDAEMGRRSIEPLLAAMLVGLDPLLVSSSTQLMTETLAALLVSVLIWVAVRDVITQKRPILLGIVFGLCCLCRPTFWAFGGLASVVWLARLFGTRSNAVRFESQPSPPDPQPTLDPPTPIVHPRRLAFCVVLGTAITIAPWAIRNWVMFGRPIITTTHGGYTLLLGHNPVYYREVVQQPWGTVWSGQSLTAWQTLLETALRADGVQPFDEVARDRWMYRQAWQNIADGPGMAVRAGLTLLGRFWGVMPLNTPERSLPAVLRWGIGLFYVAEFLAMGLGLWRLTRKEWSRWWPLVALIVSFTCVHSLYWADMRMRAPLVPAIALLAAKGLSAKGQGPSVEGRG